MMSSPGERPPYNECPPKRNVRILSSARLPTVIGRGLFGLVTVALATLVRASIEPVLQTGSPFAFHVAAVVVSAWLAGIEGAVVSTIGSALAVNYFIMEPRFAFSLSVSDQAATLIFAAVCGAIGWQTARWRAAERALIAGRAALQRRAQRLEFQVKERERAEQAARASQQLLRTTLDNFPTVIAFKDREGRFIDVNPAVERALGVPKAEIVGRTVDEFVAKVGADMIRQHDLEVMESRRAGEYEEMIPLPGRTAHFLDTHFPLIDPDGEVYGTGHIAHEITGIKEAQEALRVNERKLTALMDATTDSIWLLDRKTVLAANAMAARRVGLTPEAVRGIPWRSLGPESVAALRTGRLDEVYATGAPVRFEDERSGLRFDHTFYPVFDDDGSVFAVAAYSRDVTEQRKAEEGLREMSQRLDDHVKHSPLAVIEFGPDMRLTRWTGGAERLFGWTAEEVLGKRMSELRWVYEDDATDVHRVSRSLHNGAETGRFSANRNYRKDGTVVFCEWYNSSLLDASGKLRSLLSLVLDVTDRKRLEQELRAQAQQLTNANRLKDDFLATLSHELRTPINAILGWAQILQMGGLTPDRVHRGLETIVRNSRLQAQLVEDLLDVSRIVTGGVRLDIQQVDVRQVVDHALDAVRPGAEAKQLAVSAVVDPGLTTSADPVRLQQVLWNLLSNGVKFTPRGGSVRVLAHRAGAEMEISVTDSGVGIQSDFLPHVFERFRQADSSPTRERGGLGLGLAIVRHIVELHGGTVSAASEGRGHGTTFTVRLPVGATQSSLGSRADGHAPGVHSHGNLSGLRVLAVDDDEDARDVVASMLAAAGADVQCVASAGEALELLPQFDPHVLVSDIAMPGIDGYAFIRRLRTAATPQAQIPAIAVTAYGSATDRNAALSAGYDRHIAKPITAEQLVTTIASLVPHAPV